MIASLNKMSALPLGNSDEMSHIPVYWVIPSPGSALFMKTGFR